MVGACPWFRLSRSLAVAVGEGVSGTVAAVLVAFTVIASSSVRVGDVVVRIWVWSRAGRCLLLECDAEEDQAHQQKKVEPHSAPLES